MPPWVTLPSNLSSVHIAYSYFLILGKSCLIWPPLLSWPHPMPSSHRFMLLSPINFSLKSGLSTSWPCFMLLPLPGMALLLPSLSLKVASSDPTRLCQMPPSTVYNDSVRKEPFDLGYSFYDYLIKTFLSH